MKDLIKTYKFKLRPTKSQSDLLESSLNTCRFIYNLCLDYKSTVYKANGSTISKNDMQKELTQLKKDYPWMDALHSQTIQDVTDRLYKTYDSFFKGGGYPRFKSKRFYKTIGYKSGVKVLTNSNKINISKIGKIKYYKSQDVKGTVKYATITKEYNGWYISLMCEMEPMVPCITTNHTIGIDMGIKDLMITSDGIIYKNNKTLYKHEAKLKKKQRELSRKKKGSKNRSKTIQELRKLYAKVKNTRKDYISKLTSEIINENQVIICEDLRTKNMMKNHKLAKSIGDASWNIIMNQLEYKAKWFNKTFIKVPAYNTSRMCSTDGCDYINKELTLKIRKWTCPSCATHHDRDINAAINIKNKGIEKLKELGHSFSTFGDIMEHGSVPAKEPQSDCY